MTDVVLALDLATNSGFCVGPVGGTPRMGPLQLGRRGATRREKGAALVRWLADMLRVEHPRMIVIEEPLNPAIITKIGATIDTAMLLYGLALLGEVISEMRGVQDVRLVPVQTVRKHFTGQATFRASEHPITGKKITSRQHAKAAVINRCRLLGWTVENDDVADAAATWHWGCSQINPRLSAQATPLFGGLR